ncbi:MAG TPA: hypothetical protein VN033_10480 [Vulgatibacter sp.]|nr:hypothetical protein [Vulgatibacter sp.]
MDWTKNWNDSLSMPRSQHWSTKIIRAIAVVWGASASIETAVGGSSTSTALWSVAGAGLLYLAAVLADSVIFTGRLADEWFEEHLDEIAPGARQPRVDVGTPAPARAR